MSNKQNDQWEESQRELAEERINDKRAYDDFCADKAKRIYKNEDEYLQSQGLI